MQDSTQVSTWFHNVLEPMIKVIEQRGYEPISRFLHATLPTAAPVSTRAPEAEEEAEEKPASPVAKKARVEEETEAAEKEDEATLHPQSPFAGEKKERVVRTVWLTPEEVVYKTRVKELEAEIARVEDYFRQNDPLHQPQSSKVPMKKAGMKSLDRWKQKYEWYNTRVQELHRMAVEFGYIISDSSEE